MTDRDPNLHKNNAAEWVMVGVLFPIRLVYTIVVWLRERRR